MSCIGKILCPSSSLDCLTGVPEKAVKKVHIYCVPKGHVAKQGLSGGFQARLASFSQICTFIRLEWCLFRFGCPCPSTLSCITTDISGATKKKRIRAVGALRVSHIVCPDWMLSETTGSSLVGDPAICESPSWYIRKVLRGEESLGVYSQCHEL